MVLSITFKSMMGDMNNFILKKSPLIILKEGFYLTQDNNQKGVLCFSMTPVHFCFLTYDTISNKDIVKQNIELLRSEIRDKIEITPDIFTCYWHLIPLDSGKTKCYIYVVSENKTVNLYLHNIGALNLGTLEREIV